MSTGGRFFAAMLAAMAILASLALAAEVSRAEYKAVVEPICKTNTQANDRISAGVRSEVRRDKLKPAATSFTKATTKLERALREIEGVPRPAADEARLSKWSAFIKTEA